MNKNLRLSLSTLEAFFITTIFYINSTNGFPNFLYSPLNPCRPVILGILGARRNMPWFCPDLLTQRILVIFLYYLIIFLIFFIVFDWLMRIISKKIRSEHE